MTDAPRNGRTTRRQVLACASALVGAGAIGMPRAKAQGIAANPAALAIAINKVTGGADIKPGKVKLDLPPLSENGNSVSLSLAVDSPMTPTDHVKAVHIFTEKNPQPNVLSIKLGPRAGRAAISSRIRLADTQTVTAIAEMSDGTFWSGTTDVVVTLGACLEDTQ